MMKVIEAIVRLNDHHGCGRRGRITSPRLFFFISLGGEFPGGLQLVPNSSFMTIFIKY